MIRSALPTETAALRALWDACFADEGGFNDYFFGNIYQSDETLVDEQNGVLRAMLQMLPYRLQLDGQVHEVTYIYGACTSPDHRRKGLMAKLLAHSFALDRAAGRAASILIPQQAWLFDFYKPFGYEPVFYVGSRTVQRTGDGIAPRRLTEADIPQLAACYARACGTGALLRDAHTWATQLQMFDALGRGAFGWFEGDTLAAYAFCWDDYAQEAVGLTAAYADGLLAALGRSELRVMTPGGQTPLGCAKWHGDARISRGYFNLLFN